MREEGQQSAAGRLLTPIQRQLDIAVYLLILTGFATVAFTGSVDMPTILFAASALLLRGYLLFTRQPVAIPEQWTTFLTLGYGVFYLADLFFLSGVFVNATVHLVLFVMVVRLFSSQRDRDYYFQAIVAFLMVLAAAILTVDSLFLLMFALFALAGVAAVILLEIKRSVANASFSSR